MNKLIENIDKLHTTELGISRIKRNLELENNDIIKWCKNKILKAEKIIRIGKNWYINNGNIIITVNVNSYTIITAHKNIKN